MNILKQRFRLIVKTFFLFQMVASTVIKSHTAYLFKEQGVFCRKSASSDETLIRGNLISTLQADYKHQKSISKSFSWLTIFSYKMICLVSS